jgi:hypothetical protein
MEQRSNLYKLIERQLGASLADYVLTRRPEQSWRTIAAELSGLVGIEVNHESLRLWFSESDDSTRAGVA